MLSNVVNKDLKAVPSFLILLEQIIGATPRTATEILILSARNILVYKMSARLVVCVNTLFQKSQEKLFNLLIIIFGLSKIRIYHRTLKYKLGKYINN